MLKGEGPGARKEIFYISDDGDFAALRYNKWKISFLTQECNGQDVWDCTYTAHRFPRMTDLRADPFERASAAKASMYWQDWQFRRAYLMVPAQGMVGNMLNSFAKYPPRNKPASFSVGDALKTLETAGKGH